MTCSSNGTPSSVAPFSSWSRGTCRAKPFHRRSFLALQRTLAGDQISLDLFDEAVEGFEQADELGELDRLDGIRSEPLPDVLVGVPELPSEVGAAVIAEAESILREANETPSASAESSA